MTPIHLQLALIAVMLVILLWALYVQRNARTLLAKVRATDMGARHALLARINAAAGDRGWEVGDGISSLEFLTSSMDGMAAALIRRQRSQHSGSNPPAPSTRPTPPPNPPPAPSHHLPPDPFEWDPHRGPGIKVYTADGTCYELRDIERACRIHHHLRTIAAAHMWEPTFTEGLVEFVMRQHYEQGVADARTTPLSEAVRDLALKWDHEADDGDRNASASAALIRCSKELLALVDTPKKEST